MGYDGHLTFQVDPETASVGDCNKYAAGRNPEYIEAD
jgi:hypothetical protein